MSGKRLFGRMASSGPRGSAARAGSFEPTFTIQQSSMLTYWYPTSAMPEAIMASAAFRTSLAVMWRYQVYQSFQPIGGVRASVSPTTIVSARSSRPEPFSAFSVTAYRPRSSGVRPVRMPVFSSRRREAGRFSAAKAIGRSPVHGMR